MFWSAHCLPSPTAPFNSSGQHVAAAAWTRALVRHAQINNVDIFAALTSVEQCVQQFQDVSLKVDGAHASAPSFFPSSDLPGRLRSLHYDVLHIPQGIDFERPSYARSRLAGGPFPVTCSQHGISYNADVHPCFTSLLTAQVYPCDAIVCLTQASRLAMQKRLTDIAERYSRAWDRPAPLLPRLELIPWGVDTQRFAPRDQGAARRDLDLPLDRPILLCVGRMRIQDKMDWTPLLLAFEHLLRSARERPLLVLAGAASSEYGERLLAQAVELGLRNDLRAFFNFPAACLPSLYAACDLFISPVDSPSESFGLTVVEAMACGRPVVASDWDGYKELIVHGETGFKVRTDWADCLGELNQLAPVLYGDQEHLHVGQSVSVDMRQMVGYLRQLVQNRELREAMGRRGRARALELYDWPIVVAQWQGLWGELAGIARSITEGERDRLDYLQSNYFQHFAHYASRIVDDNTPVQLTDRGKHALAGRVPLRLDPGARGFLDPRHLRHALEALRPYRRARASLPLGRLTHTLLMTQGLSRDRALMHLMWLAKYGLVSLAGGDSSRAETLR